jgi:hypothetical protein
MTVYFEVLSVGANVTARVVLQGASFTREVARLSLSQALWDDFTNCLNKPPRNERGRIVFAAVPKADPPPAEEEVVAVPCYRREAVA